MIAVRKITRGWIAKNGKATYHRSAHVLDPWLGEFPHNDSAETDHIANYHRVHKDQRWRPAPK